MPAPSEREPLAKPESCPYCQRPHLRGQQQRPLPAAETGSHCWGRGQRDASAAQGAKRMLGATTRQGGRPQAAKKSPVGSFLVFGSQSSGMSTVVAAALFDPNGNQSKNSPACTIRQAGVRYARKQMMSFYGLWPMPPSSVRVSPDIYLKSGMASWTQTRPISVSALP